MKKNEIKPRINSITGNFVANSDKIKFSLKDGSLVAESDNGDIPMSKFKTETFYKREKNDKILNRIYTDNNSIDINRNLSQYNFIYAIDTNTMFTDNKYISVGSLVKGDFIKKNEEGFNLSYKCHKNFIIESEYKYIDVEQYLWTESIKLIKNELILHYNPKIGLIIDCDLGNLENYNNKLKPLYSNFYLPDNFTLIYASSDTGKEYLPNKMIALADHEAKANINLLNI